MKTFYILELSTSQIEIGKSYPQIEKMGKEYNYNSQNSVYKLARYHSSFPDFVPDLSYFLLNSNSIPTDFISNAISAKGIIVSEKVVELFNKINHCPLKFYPAEIMHKSVILNSYFWMHINSDYTDKINYSKSKFIILENYKYEHGYIKIDSFEDYIKKKDKLISDNPDITLTIWGKELVLFKEFADLDFFEIGKFDSNLYISDLFLELILKNNLTGLTIKENNIIRIDK